MVILDNIVIFVGLQVLGIKKPKNKADSSRGFRPRSSSSKFYKHLFPEKTVTNEDHSNDKSSDEDTQKGQCHVDVHNVLGSSLVTFVKCSHLTTKHA